MASINRATIIGNVGRDPELRYSAAGAAVCNVAIATSRNWKDKTSGEKVEETEWHRVVFYDRLAEIAGEYLKKGRSVYVEGRLKTRKWQDKEGVERYTTEIVADNMQMLGGRDDGGQQQGAPARQGSSSTQARQQGAATRPAPAQRPASSGFDDMDDEEIPF